MGDSFFKFFFGACFVLLFIAGAVMFVSMQKETVDRREIKRFVETRGAGPVPRSWKGKIGEGI